MKAEPADGKQRAGEETRTPSDEFSIAVAENVDTARNSAVREKIAHKIRYMSYPHLFLADGRRADSLRRGPLRAELTRIGVPVVHDMSKIEMLALLAAHNESIGATSETRA